MVLRSVNLTIARFATHGPLTTSRTLPCEHRGRPAAATRSQAVKALDLQSFGESNFGGLDLGDARRPRRLAELVDKMCRHPGGTLPAKWPKPSDLRAFYLLMDCDKVTHASVMGGHTEATHRKMEAVSREGNTILILHDATELDYTSLTTLRGKLGQIGRHRDTAVHGDRAIGTRDCCLVGSRNDIAPNAGRGASARRGCATGH